MKTVPPAQLRQACNRREAERGPLLSTACVPRCLTSAPRTSLSTGDRFKQPGRPRPGREGKEWDVPGSELSPHDRALPQSKETRGEETPEGKIVATVSSLGSFLLFLYSSNSLQCDHFYTIFII